MTWSENRFRPFRVTAYQLLYRAADAPEIKWNSESRVVLQATAPSKCGRSLMRDPDQRDRHKIGRSWQQDARDAECDRHEQRVLGAVVDRARPRAEDISSLR